MRDVRLIYKKQGRAKYISHLDMNRLFSRIIKRSKLPIWYTEGFNPHAFFTFALPLSLGFVSEYDICDFRITDDSLDNQSVADILRKAVPESIEVVDVIAPVMKVKELAFACFKVQIEATEQNADKLIEFLEAPQIQVEKTTKKKGLQIFDVKPMIKELKIEKNESGLDITLLLPCGVEQNINPSIIFASAEKTVDFEIVSVTRGMLYDKNMQVFR